MQPEQERRDPSYIRSIVMEEVGVQLKPITIALQQMTSWRLRIWNDNGGPPGYLQTRRLEDDNRHVTIKEDLKAQNDKLEDQNEKLKPLVAFVEEQRILKEDRQKRWQFWSPIIKRVALGVGSGLLALSCWLGPKIVHVGIILWEDYIKYHPEVNEKMKTVDSQPNAGLSSAKKPPEVSGSGAVHY